MPVCRGTRETGSSRPPGIRGSASGSDEVEELVLRVGLVLAVPVGVEGELLLHVLGVGRAELAQRVVKQRVGRRVGRPVAEQLQELDLLGGVLRGGDELEYLGARRIAL